MSSHRKWLICVTRFSASTAPRLSLRDLCIPPALTSHTALASFAIIRMGRLSVWLFHTVRAALGSCRSLQSQMGTNRHRETPHRDVDKLLNIFSGGGRHGVGSWIPKRERSKSLVLISFFFTLKCPSCIFGLSSQNPAISITENVLHFKGEYPSKCSQLSK